MKPQKLLDASASSRLFELQKLADDGMLTLNLDYCNLRPPECRWIIQLFDLKEHEIITGRGESLTTSLSSTLDKLRGKGLC